MTMEEFVGGVPPFVLGLLAWAVVGGCAAVFLLGLVLWARQSNETLRPCPGW